MRQERIALFLLVGVTTFVVAANIALSFVGKQPFARPFSETSLDGEMVVIEGTVAKISPIENGGHLSVLVGNTTIFIPASAARGIVVQRNDMIRAYGIVETYRGKKEIVINTVEDFRIITIP
jgi:DNA/RNA endonuclease YhcR with UshA esterase domain